jgi:hypothetical protein
MHELFRSQSQLNGQFLGVTDLDDLSTALDGASDLVPDPAEKAPDSQTISPETVVLTPDLPISGSFLPIEVPRTVRLSVCCTPEARDWVKGLAHHCSLDCTSLIWQSLIRQGENSGYHLRAPHRYDPQPTPPQFTPRRPSVF